MNRNIFKDYIDACELEKELEERIRDLEQQSIAHDVVSGSNPEHPYQAQHFHTEGVVTEGVVKQIALEVEWNNLKWQQEKVKQIRQQAEKIIEQAPPRIQRIIRYKYFDKLSWEEIADKIRHGASGESIRKEFQRFLKNN